jgi:hypothetical protein
VAVGVDSSYWGRSNFFFIRGKKGSILVITIKRGAYWGAVGTVKLVHLPPYDRFMGMRDEKGELLEMLLSSLANY